LQQFGAFKSQQTHYVVYTLRSTARLTFNAISWTFTSIYPQDWLNLSHQDFLENILLKRLHGVHVDALTYTPICSIVFDQILDSQLPR